MNFLLIFTFISLCFSKTYQCGTDITCTYDDTTGTKGFTVSGTGSMNDYEDGSQPWYEVMSEITSITISEGVKKIGKNAFKDASNTLGKLTIPKSITEIGESAFQGIGNDELEFAQDIQLSTIKKRAFHAIGISSIILPNSVRTIEEEAFADDYNANQVTLNNGLQTIGKRAFSNVRIESISIPASVTSMELDAFESGSNIKFVVATGNTVYSSDDKGVLFKMIDGKKALVLFKITDKTYQVPEGVQIIYEKAFNQKWMQSITLPSTLIEIQDSAFARNNIQEIIIPDNVVSIGIEGFAYCSSLKTVKIGKSLTNIKKGIFRDCSNIETFTVSSENTRFSSDDKGILYANNGKVLVKCAKGAANLGKITIPSAVEVIYDAAFKGLSLTELEIRGNTYSIHGSAFQGCKSLKTVTIDAPISAIGSNVFQGCTELTTVSLSDKVTMIGDNMFSGCTKLATFTMSKNVLTIESFAFQNTKIKSIVIPSTTRFLKGRAFKDCTELQSVTIGKKIFQISQYAFEGCTKLTSVTFEEGIDLRRIDKFAFNGCSSLISIQIPSTVQIISPNSFAKTTSLESFKFLGNTQPNFCSSSAFEESKILDVENGIITGSGYQEYEFCGVRVRDITA